MLKRLVFTLIVVVSIFLISKTKIEAGSCSPIFPATTCDVTDSVTVTATVADSTATFTGLAAGSSVITVKDNSVATGTILTNPSSNFSGTVVSTPGLHDFALFLTDTSGRTTPETTYLGINLPFHVDTSIINILMPPTIDLSRSSILMGETTAVLGQGSIGSTIHIVLNGSEVYSGILSSSDYNFLLSSGYTVGSNTIYSYLTRSGYTTSVNSFSKTLTVGNCRRSDLNCDGHVNLTDFSILLYYWNTTNPKADINLDGKVGLIDFSIMMFDWTD